MNPNLATVARSRSRLLKIYSDDCFDRRYGKGPVRMQRTGPLFLSVNVSAIAPDQP
jgi:hypothetical protein